MWLLVIQRLLIEALLDFIYFPFWWYTSGLKHWLFVLVRLFKDGNLILLPGLWLKNLFVPMFGQTDFQGRLMSIFMRLVNVIARGIALFVWFLIIVIIFLLWIVFPIFVLFMLIRSFSA